MTESGWQQVWSSIDSLVRFGIKPGLDRMQSLLEALDHPEHSFRTIQVAGSNGKGSTAFLLEDLLRSSGLKTGLFTSPHILHPAERIRIAGTPCNEEQVLEAWQSIKPLLPAFEPSYFELLTALAFQVFRLSGVEVAVLECGLGGRFDATSVVQPVMGILTSIGPDHLEILGPTLKDVLRDKVQIAPAGGRLLCGKLDPDLRELAAELCQERDSQISWLDPQTFMREDQGAACALTHLQSEDQIQLPAASTGWIRSAELALEAFRLLREQHLIEPDTARVVHPSLEDWPGRFQLLRQEPPLLLDTAHNQDALELLVADIRSKWPDRKFRVLLTGMKEKALHENLLALRPLLGALEIWLPDEHPRSAARSQWQDALAGTGIKVGSWLDDQALLQVRQETMNTKSPECPILVCGSFTIVARWLGAENLPPGL